MSVLLNANYSDLAKVFVRPKLKRADIDAGKRVVITVINPAFVPLIAKQIERRGDCVIAGARVPKNNPGSRPCHRSKNLDISLAGN